MNSSSNLLRAHLKAISLSSHVKEPYTYEKKKVHFSNTSNAMANVIVASVGVGVWGCVHVVLQYYFYKYLTQCWGTIR